MEVSKVTLTKSTLIRNSLSRARRTELRQEVVKDVIRNRPTGTPLSLRDLTKDCHFSTQANAWAFVNGLVERGILTKERIVGSRKARYTIPNDTVIKKLTPPAPAPIPEPEPPVETVEYTDIEEKARSFSWTHNSDSLREFITWLKG